MSKELKQLEKWIDENKGTALHPIMGNNPSITQLFIDTLLQKITELKAEEELEDLEAKSIDEEYLSRIEQGYYKDSATAKQLKAEEGEEVKISDGFVNCKDCGQKKLAGIQCRNSEGICEIDKINRMYDINPPKP